MKYWSKLDAVDVITEDIINQSQDGSLSSLSPEQS